MDAILPFKIKNEQKFYESALKVGYNEMEILKFIYIVQQSDLDIFPKMHDERINILLYGWELCEDYKQKLNPNEWELPEEMETVIKLLVPWSMDIWFSKEWDKSKYLLRSALIHCLNRARDLLMRMPDMMQINWDFLLLYNLKPWNVLYLKNLSVTREKTLENGAQCIETEESPASDEDVAYVKLEQLPTIVLRLVKIFDQSSIDMVKTLCMRVITAWNKIYQIELETSGSRRPYIPPEDKRCLLLICHIYLMAVYESDDVKGYIIDNMINNIRFYYQGFQNSTPLYGMDNLEYTSARYIALTNFHLRVQKRDFFDFFIWNKYDTALVNLFGVVSQAYKSYLLGNLLMELNNMNEDDFAANTPLYKRLMNSYVNEREKSEAFLMNELNKIEAQRYAHNIIQTVKNVTDFKSKICKGNRMSNIGNYENSDDTVAPLGDTKTETNSTEVNDGEFKEDVVVCAEEIEDEQERVRVKENELRLDPVFQYLPHNESILYYVYDVLAKKDYTGWHFAKIVVLVKIIGFEQNMIETWRYHPGLTTDFMLNLEFKLSNHYVDLAKIFKDHPFLEQEFWLTAFYLNPSSDIYEVIKRLGMRNNRKRTDEHTKLVMSIDNIDAKYGLLSSTIDVKELATMANTDDPVADYDPLFSALHSLRVPDSLVKDMLTAIFLPRNRSFAWAVDWVILRNRCKMIMNSSKEKKRFVDLNMAEANERLKYLIIDYEKYKNRPQLDYGTIEEGYENLMTSAEFDKESEEEEEEDEDDFEDDEDVYESKKRGRKSLAAMARKKEEEKVEDDNSQEDDPFLMGKRRTRARTAATLASFLFQTLPRTSRRKRNQKALEEENKIDEEKLSAEQDANSSGSKSPITAESPIPSPASSDQKISNIPTKNLKECLKDRPSFLNTTQGFQNLIDIWNVEKSDLQSIDENCVSLLESANALQIAVKLKSLNKEINPSGCDEKEYIDDIEMIIHNADFFIKKEYELEEDAKETAQNIHEPPDAMEIEMNKLNVEADSIKGMDRNVTFANVEQPEEETQLYDNLEKCLIEKATGGEIAKIVHNQEIQPVEENSNHSINSDVSTIARKGSGEVSESNTEINSKRNSFNMDIEMEDKIMQIDDTNERTDTATELKKSTHCTGLQLANDKQPNRSDFSEANSSQYFQDNRIKKNTDSSDQDKAEKKDEEEKGKEVHEVEGSRMSEQLLSLSDASKHIDGTNVRQAIEMPEPKDMRTSNCNEISEESKNNANENESTETEFDSRNGSNYNTISGALRVGDDKETDGQILQGNIADNHSKISDKATNQNVNNEISGKSKVNDNSEQNKEILIQQLQVNDGSNHNKLTEKTKENKEVVAQGTKTSDEDESKATFIEQIIEEELQLFKDLQKSTCNENEPIYTAESCVESVTELNEKNSNKSPVTMDCNNFMATENVQEVKKAEELEINKNGSGSDTNSKENNGSQNYVNKWENTGNDIEDMKQNEEILESEVVAQTNNTERNNLSQTSNGGKLTDDKDSLCELQTIAATEELDRQSVTNHAKLEGIECRKEETTTTAQQNVEILESCVDRKDIEATDGNEILNPLMALLDGSSCDSIPLLTQHEESSDDESDETKHLKNLCLTRNVKVYLQKLRPADLTNLRQPTIKIQRMSFESNPLELRSKRRRIEGKVYMEFEDSSNSNNSFATNTTSSFEAYRPPRVKRKVPLRRYSVKPTHTSESENDSNNSDDYKLSTIMKNARKRRLSTASTSQSSTSQHVTGPKSARKLCSKSSRRPTGPKSSKQNLIVTPRSASGLKLRISSAEQNQQDVLEVVCPRPTEVIVDDIIQLSSSSDEYVLNDLTAIEEVIEVEEYPLFEEEIII